MDEINRILGRPIKILWATPFCLLDTSNGASISAREILIGLKKAGADVSILGATIFDDPKGVSRIKTDWEEIFAQKGNIVTIEDSGLSHKLLVTNSTYRNEMKSIECDRWFAGYYGFLENEKPDLVIFYGGQCLEFLIPDAARDAGIPSLAYLVNPNYSGERWIRDITGLFTDSAATAQMYKAKCGYEVAPVGTFVDPGKVASNNSSGQNILFINPSIEKGAGIVVQLASIMQKMRPEIVFEIIESRGSWPNIYRDVLKTIGQTEPLKNIKVTSHTSDMRPIYARAKFLLVPSLWWDSGPRVIPEALFNGIPVITTNHGGCPEMVGTGGAIIKLPPECHTPPYNRLPQLELLTQVASYICSMYDDDLKYRNLQETALLTALERHDINKNINNMISLIKKIVIDQKLGA